MAGNSVDDFLVHTGAGGGGERGAAVVLVRIILEQRIGATAAKVLGHDRVDIGGGYARNDNLANQLVCLPDANAGLAHQSDLAFGFELNHVTKGAGKKPENCPPSTSRRLGMGTNGFNNLTS
jgi:hypothetical protein